MFNPLRKLVLRVTLVPPEPHPPLGAPGSIKIFRAGRNFYRLRLLGWTVGQLGALIGIVVSVCLIRSVDLKVTERRATREANAVIPTPATVGPSSAAPEAPTSNSTVINPSGWTPPGATKSKSKVKRVRKALTFERLVSDLAQATERWPRWMFPMIKLFELGTISLFIVQIPLTYAAVRLAFEQHWYIVTDRSLRIRTGLIFLKESTMSFANLQQVELQQGPLQRLLGLANVRVQSAGGGGESSPNHGGDSLHTGVFDGVDNAPEIRDLILDRLRRFREAGLGDSHDTGHAASDATIVTSVNANTLAAANELLVEARALRSALLN